jgi:hypothetical protein
MPHLAKLAQAQSRRQALEVERHQIVWLKEIMPPSERLQKRLSCGESTEGLVVFRTSMKIIKMQTWALTCSGHHVGLFIMQLGLAPN